MCFIVQEKNVQKEGNCSQVARYTEDICSSELGALQTCFSGATIMPSIPANVDQHEMELIVTVWLNALPLLVPNPECVAVIRPFLCLHAFGLCDIEGAFHGPTMENCLQVRDITCPSVWTRAVDFLGPGVLPECEFLPNITEECTGKTFSTITIGSNSASLVFNGNIFSSSY